MKKTQEFEGKNIDQAIETACSTLNITKKKLSYDVISTGSSGIFGIVGVKKAKIRVNLPAPANDGDNRSSLDADDMDGIMSIVDEAFGETRKQKADINPKTAEEVEPEDKSRTAPPQADRPEKKQAPQKKKPPRPRPQDKPKEQQPRQSRKPAQPRKKQGPALPETEADTPEETVIPGEAQAPVPPPDTESDASMNQPGPETDTIEVPGDPDVDATLPGASDTDILPVDDDEEIDEWEEGFPPKYKDEIPVDVPEEAMKLGVEALQKIVDLITTDAVVEAESDQDRLLLKVKGGNSGVLIGRRGQTMEAMQFITDKIINRTSESRVRLRVDVEGYMETRKANLISLAHKMADKAKKTGKPATINQMTAQDRRTVHLALKDDSAVRTQSMGDGYYRRLVIFPKKGTFKKRRPPKK